MNRPLLQLALLKGLRDLRSGWLSFGACALTIGLATCLFVAFVSASENLRTSCEGTYQRLRFLDFSIQVKNAPPSAVDKIRAIPGVEAATGRLSLGVKFLLDPPHVPAHRSRSVRGNVIGFPFESQPLVNKIHLEKGRYFSATRGEILLEKRFAEFHGFDLGDPIRVKSDEGERRYQVVGIVSSPEFLWLTDDRFDPRPSFRHFGVGFVTDADARSLTSKRVIDEIHVRVEAGAPREEIMRAAEEQLLTFTAEPPVPREEQPSHSHLLRDRRAFATVAVVFPAVFLTLSSLILFFSIWQLVSRQRRQIGVMMAQGVSSLQLFVHYVLLSLLVAGSGALAGNLGGLFLGRLCTRLYTETLGVPFVETRVPWFFLGLATTFSLLVSLVAAWSATRRILELDPVSAIRAEFSAHRSDLGLKLRLSLPVPLLMAMRNLVRHPGRALLCVVGIALSVAQIVMALCLFESQERTVEFYFARSHRYDLQVNLRGRGSLAHLPPIERWQGVQRVESLLTKKLKIRTPKKLVSSWVWGVSEESRLVRFYRPDFTPLTVERGKLYLGRPMLRRLGAEPGDIVTIEVERKAPDPPRLELQLVEIHEPIANPPKMLKAQLQSFCEASHFFPTEADDVLLVSTTPDSRTRNTERLRDEERVSGVISFDLIKNDVQDVLRLLNTYKAVMLIFTSVFAFIVLLAVTTMNVLERTRDLATLSCMGVGDGTLLGILGLETLGLWLMSLVGGIPAGVLLGQWLVASYQSELVQIQLDLSPGALVGTALFSLFICALAVAAALIRIGYIPLTEATCERFD